MDNNLHLVSWNVCGLCEPDRKFAVKLWLNSHRPKVDILALQEVKADPFRLDIALRTILPDFTHISSPPDDGRGGTALLISPKIQVLSSGSLDLGRAVWFQASLDQICFGLICVYAPNSPR